MRLSDLFSSASPSLSASRQCVCIWISREAQAKPRTLISSCDCENGCPGCVGPVGNTGPMAKVAALRILDLLTQSPLPAADTAAVYDEEAQPF